MGGTWALWYALARPKRVRHLLLLEAVPLLPGTRIPPLLRLMAMPVVGDLLQRVIKPSPKMACPDDEVHGREGHDRQLSGADRGARRSGQHPFVSTVNLAELRAAISLFGFRRALRVQPDELRQLTVPTLLVWGDHNPVGAVEIATMTAKLIPNAQLELLAAGHGPWLGYPDRTAELMSTFVHSARR